jgi:hypothetical protein
MWLGLLYLTPDEAAELDCEETVVLLAWQAGRARPLTIGGPVGAVAPLARLLREAAAQASLLPPRCDACGTPLDLPLD